MTSLNANGAGFKNDVSYALNTTDQHAVYDPSVHHGYKELGDISETVRARYGTGGNNTPMVLEGEVKYWDGTDVVGTLSVRNAGGSQRMPDKDNFNGLTDGRSVRRLTPMECERLQGFPDGWTDIPGATDSKRYKALGNSIALPFWEHLAKRFVEIGNVKNIGSLFDGIGGFPLVFQRAGAGTKWTSEIEPFCEDVVRYHVESGNLW